MTLHSITNQLPLSCWRKRLQVPRKSPQKKTKKKYRSEPSVDAATVAVYQQQVEFSHWKKNEERHWGIFLMFSLYSRLPLARVQLNSHEPQRMWWAANLAPHTNGCSLRKQKVCPIASLQVSPPPPPQFTRWIFEIKLKDWGNVSSGAPLLWIRYPKTDLSWCLNAVAVFFQPVCLPAEASIKQLVWASARLSLSSGEEQRERRRGGETASSAVSETLLAWLIFYPGGIVFFFFFFNFFLGQSTSRNEQPYLPRRSAY